MESGQRAQIWLAPYERAFARDTKPNGNETPNPRPRICKFATLLGETRRRLLNTEMGERERDTIYRYLSRDTSSRFLSLR